MTTRQEILDLVACYAETQFAQQPFSPGVASIPASGKVIGKDELVTLVDAALDGWLTSGRYNELFEKNLGDYIGVSHVLTTNSGSSANLLAISALTSPKLGDRALVAGDEVITAAAGFPTTINPILQNGLVPVFVDSEIPTYNPTPAHIEAAVGPKTKAIIIAHTLGNPYAVAEVREIADRYGLWLVEDCCDALGSTYRGRKVGTFGHIGTLSCYPAHHITMGEGGAVYTADPQLRRLLESFRDWGRDCYCAPGRDNTCGQRFGWQLGDLPAGYDHKYIYAHAGYNLKITDMQAALGVAQLSRIEEFCAIRRHNFARLRERMAEFEEFLILPEATPDSDPSWFGFPITLRESAGCDRVDLLRYLDEQRIGTRLIFAGNVTRQPYFAGRTYRVSGTLDNADLIMKNTFHIGTFPGIDDEMIDYMADRIGQFFGFGF
ncbi:MAG: lipopolysaccharide biosynthesis protein RfbH [Candidatus Competibacteraceae bacterium]|nr:MAG: lipopolysaccharide biosynthesis protein RfbH [Candidatus Competibacteraceae bacterium]